MNDAPLAGDRLALLQELGLTRSEAQTYVTLLEAEEVEGLTGYELAARSGVPRSAIYTVLGSLEAHGAAFRSGESPVRYVPTAPDRFVAHLRATTEARLARAAESLAQLPKRSRPEPVWIVSTYGEVLRTADRLIRSAQRSVTLSLWGREVAALRPALEAAAGRPGLHRVLHSPDLAGAEVAGFSCWTEDLRGDPTKATWSHKLIVVVDHREALLGGSEPQADNQAVLTTNRSLVDVAVNHVILDINRLAAATGRPCDAVVSPMMRPHLAPAGGPP